MCGGTCVLGCHCCSLALSLSKSLYLSEFGFLFCTRKTQVDLCWSLRHSVKRERWGPLSQPSLFVWKEVGYLQVVRCHTFLNSVLPFCFLCTEGAMGISTRKVLWGPAEWHLAQLESVVSKNLQVSQYCLHLVSSAHEKS